MRFLLAASLAFSTSAVAFAAMEGKPLTFNHDIRPILSDKCFACHGFDSKHREAELRLDVEDGAFRVKDGVTPIVPGNLEKSEVWQRIIATDKDDVMPPPKSHKTLTAAERETIKRWIEQGAKYQKHWAFEAPAKPAVPGASGSVGAGAIDAFLAARLASEGLAFSPEADRPTLIRRVAFTLTGLPPTVAEVEAFEKDQAPDAYEKMVDRYLASPRYGEEMARHWLDVARYGDTHGLHLDNERSMWPYRDWVVKAFNTNLPFDQFTTWQIGGDLLPNPTPDQMTATGFSRCNVTTSEGGAIDEEYRHLYAQDRTSTLITTFMGLTGGCATCHDHKYDPLTTKEYYSIYSLFFQAEDPPMDGNVINTRPVEKLPTPQQQAALDAAAKAEAEAAKALDAAAARAEYEDPASTTGEAQRRTVVIFDDVFPPGAEVRNTSRNPSHWELKPKYGAPSGQRVLRQANGSFFEDTINSKLRPITLGENPVVDIWVRLEPLSAPSSVAIMLEDRRVYWGGQDAENDYDARKAGKVLHAGALPTPGVWTKLSFDPTALGLKPGTRINKLALQHSGGAIEWDLCTITGDVKAATDPLASFTVWWKGSTKAQPPEVPGEIAATLNAGPDATKDEAKRKALLNFYLARVAHPANDEIARARESWNAARAAREAADAAIPSTFVFRDTGTPRQAHVMIRGQYNKPGDPVEPITPAFLPAPKLPDGAKLTRLDLAKWLISSEHPLMARVTVNRLWQQIFGTGLVKTSHDFGSQGQPPSHPELLDWLAVTFREGGWDVRGLVRAMVLTRAFRQQSAFTPELLSRDPENRLLARGPRFRLDAEQIRDNALYVSGLINLRMGGKGARTYQPPNIWEPVGYGDSNTRYYLQDHGDALYRRSLYCFLKRTAPPPFMSNFDAPNREQTCPRRERSNTPMQALQLMNDVQHFEAARALAERSLAECQGDDAARLGWMFRTVLSRRASEKELALLTDALKRQRELYQADPPAAEKVIRTGESKPRKVAAAPETAAWTLVANAILNFDETLNRN